jgi:hypothetical protein
VLEFLLKETCYGFQTAPPAQDRQQEAPHAEDDAQKEVNERGRI